MSISPFLRHIQRCQNISFPSPFSDSSDAPSPQTDNRQKEEEKRIPLFYGQKKPENLVGWVTPSLLPSLQAACCQDLLQVTGPPSDKEACNSKDSDTAMTLLLNPMQTTLNKLSDILARKGVFTPFNELFDVHLDEGTLIGQVDRGLIPLLGVRAEGVHLNGFVQKKEGLFLWIARRSPTKRLDPSKLDNLAAGGINAGLTPEQALAKEAAEEANIPESCIKTARKTARISYMMNRNEGLRRDTLHCFDIMLPDNFQPQAIDGEVEDFCLMPLQAVFERVRDTDDFKFNVNLILIDLLIRHHFFEEKEERQLREALNHLS